MMMRFDVMCVRFVVVVRTGMSHPPHHLRHARSGPARRLVHGRMTAECRGHEDHPPVRHGGQDRPEHRSSIAVLGGRQDAAHLVRERSLERAERLDERRTGLPSAINDENQPVVRRDVVQARERTRRTSTAALPDVVGARQSAHVHLGEADASRPIRRRFGETDHVGALRLDQDEELGHVAMRAWPSVARAATSEGVIERKGVQSATLAGAPPSGQRRAPAGRILP